MKDWGIVLLIAGALGVFLTFYLISGATPGYPDTYNIGLLNLKSNWITICCFISLIGAIWIAFGYYFDPKPETERTLIQDTNS